MEKKTTKRISVLAALLLVFTMLFTAIVFSTVGKTRAFADGEGNVLLYIVDTGRVNDQYGDQLQYGYDPAEKTPTYVDSTKTFIKREGGTFGDITEYNGNPLTRLCNSYTDHPYGEDPTGKYWGFNEDYTEDMPHRLGRGGDYSGGFSEFRSVNDDEVTTERLIYKFEVPNGNALDVTVITCAPAGWGTVNGKMSVNGGEAIPLVAQEGKSYEERHSIEGCTGVLNNEDSRYYLTLTFGEEGAKTVICGIIIRTAPDNYNVSYNLDGGTNNAANKATYTYGEGLTLADPTREGYAFGGWYDKETGGNKVTAISVTQWGDVTLYARWNAIYAITYNLNGGINNAANTATYTQSIGLTLADPTRTGYTFVGWYDEAEGGNKVTAISDSQTG
ncbi:MAG: InlB B-repeat-containing protein, partial [Clostridia bacterium]|nr:InlB B-repeat-containing protein [Clostridia bacterium]